MAVNARTLKKDGLWIGQKRYKELCGFCEQYPEWRRRMGSMERDGDRGPEYGRMERDCRMVEDAAREAAEDLWQYMIKAVCYEVPLTRLLTVDGMPMSKSTFFERRRKFFWILDGLKKSEYR